jgi:hypothetical protein
MSPRRTPSRYRRLDELRALLDTPRSDALETYAQAELLELQQEAERLAEELGVEL